MSTPPRHRYRVTFLSGVFREVCSTSATGAKSTARQANRVVGLVSRDDMTPLEVTDLGHAGTDTHGCPMCERAKKQKGGRR